MFENILYATDFSESSLMLPCIGIIGKTKKMHLLYVVNEETQVDPSLYEPRMEEVRSFLDEQLNAERNKGITADVHLMPGLPGRGICATAEKLDASLIVVNYHEPGSPAGSATTELIHSCRRDLLVMTTLSSDTVDQSNKAMENYCTNLFRHVICPLTGDPKAKLVALGSLKDEVHIGRVTFLCFSETIDRTALADSLKGMGIEGEAVMAKSTRREEVIEAAERSSASIIMLDNGAEMGMALAVVVASDYPTLVLKHP